MEQTPQQTAAEEHDRVQYQSLNKIIKRYGGRHLIFRTKVGGWWFMPRSYALVSSFRGMVWAFYGIGQIWLTHRKTEKIGGWMTRRPRLGSSKIKQMIDAMEPQLAEFVSFCNENGIEGTVAIETKAIEFHWTFGFELSDETKKKEHCESVNAKFESLVKRFTEVQAKLNAAGKLNAAE